MSVIPCHVRHSALDMTFSTRIQDRTLKSHAQYSVCLPFEYLLNEAKNVPHLGIAPVVPVLGVKSGTKLQQNNHTTSEALYTRARAEMSK